MPRLAGVLAIVLVAACSSSPDDTKTTAARITFSVANPAFCGQSGSPICEARVNHVEGKPVLTFASHTDIAPGARVLGLFCRINLSIMIGDAQSHQREVEVDLAPGGRYRVEARMAPRPCTMTLVDEATGLAVGKVR